MAIFRGNGGSVEGITESDTVVIAISQGGTGATTASGARTNLGLGTAATTNSTAYATAAQGALADSALQSESDPVFSASEAASITSTDTTNWDTAYTDRLKWDGGSTGLNASTGRTSLGLGTAATTASTDYATAAQGAKADTAVQPGSLATVATSGSYNDLSNKPTIPTDLNSLTDVVITSPTTDQTLQYNGTNWVNATGGGGSGTVTSVAMSVPTGLSVSGSPITSSGTLAVTYSSGYAIPTTAKQTEWDTAYTDRLKWDGGSTGLTASTGRTSLGATTVGSNLFTLTNPSAVTFPRFNADNTVSSLTASDFRTAIGAGTGSGTVTSVNLTAGTGISVSGGPVTSSGSITVTNSSPMTYPSSGVAVSTGSAWNTPLSYGTTAAASSLVQLDAGGYANTNNTFGFKNRIINGAMMIDQRGSASTPVTTTGAYFIDRFTQAFGNASCSFTQVTDAPAGFINSAKLTVTTGSSPSVGTNNAILQRIEGLNVSDFGLGTASAVTFTLSFWVKGSVTGTYAVAFTNSAFNRSYVATYTINSANTWEKKTVTVAGDTSGTWLTTNSNGLVVLWDFGSGTNLNTTAGSWQAGNYYRTSACTTIASTTNATLQITGVQLEKGSTATSFDYRPYGTELVLCQRYYQATTILVYSSSFARNFVMYPVQMRTSPTIAGGGSGFSTSVSSNAGTAMEQTSAASQNLTFSAEL